jgi:hypothetical protein
MRTIVQLDSKIFDKAFREQTVQNFVSRQARDFKVLTKQRIIESEPAGRDYARKRGAGFQRFHRASARGQRPAIDTGKLLNSIDDQMISPTVAEAFVGAEYAEFLQSERLDRPIMDENDAQEAEAKMLRDANQMLISLL